MEQQERDSAVGACCGRQRMDDAKRNVRVAEAPHATAGLDSTSIQRIIQSNYTPPRLQPAPVQPSRSYQSPPSRPYGQATSLNTIGTVLLEASFRR